MTHPASRESIAAALLSIGAVTLRPEHPFIWASGLRSPIYCDNRLVLGYPEIREQITLGFQALIESHRFDPDVIAGTATAGIPHAAWLAHTLALPMVYVRSKPKEHGRKNQVEGKLEAGRSVVVIEDLISTGMSSIAVVEALKEAGARVKAVLAIFSYGFDQARDAFAQADVPFFTLTSFDDLLTAASKQGLLDPEAIETMKAWRSNPQAWSDACVEAEDF